MSDELVEPLYDPITGTGQVAYPDDIRQTEDCKYCRKPIDILDMDYHLRSKHGRHYKGGQKIKCDFCGKRVKKIGMNNHLKAAHGI